MSFRKEVYRCGSYRGTIGSATWREIQKHRVQKYTDAGLQKYTISETQKNRNLEIQKVSARRNIGAEALERQ